MSNVIVIGSGFAGLSAASFLAKKGYEVTLLEKNNTIGGRARQFTDQGFTYDMGPSWYWMPDVFERFYNQFGRTTSDFYDLKRLDPSYQVVFEKDTWQIPASVTELAALLETYEPGATQKLQQFLSESAYKYKAGMGKFVHMPGKSLFEYFDLQVLDAATKMDLLTDMTTYIRSFFKNPQIIKLLEFPVLFLGAKPQETPALYSLMNYADLELGTWYPMGGMFKIVEAFQKIAQSQGVRIETNTPVRHIEVTNNKATGVWANGTYYPADYVVAGCDYQFADTQLLAPEYRQYSDRYWESRKMAPSSLLNYVGVNQKIPGLRHHNLFFDADFEVHANQIYKTPGWPEKPLFYASAPSVTDPSVAPESCENLFLLIPTATGLIETPEIQEMYYNKVMERLENFTKFPIRNHVVYKRMYAASNFISDYHAFKGNAYGLANTLMQTGPLKPALNHKSIKNLVFTGQLTVPGPGVPPSIISGELAAKEVMHMA